MIETQALKISHCVSHAVTNVSLNLSCFLCNSAPNVYLKGKKKVLLAHPGCPALENRNVVTTMILFRFT